MSEKTKDAREMLIENSPELAKFVETPQYKKSRELMRLRYELSLSTHEAAKLANITHNAYIDLECGTASNLNKYDDVKSRLKALDKK